MTRREQTHRKIDEAIRREKAAALGRAGERLEAAREALGLRHHGDVDRVFPELPRRSRHV